MPPLIFVMDRETQNIISLEVFHSKTLRIATALPVPPSQMGGCYAFNQKRQGLKQLSKYARQAAETAENYAKNSWVSKTITGSTIMGTNVAEQMCTE